jgi:hypothetical protein
MTGRSDPNSFVFRHNGVSIEVAAFVPNGGAAEMAEPRVLNGAQSIVALHRILFPSRGEPPTTKELDRLAEIRVLAKRHGLLFKEKIN